MRIKPVSFFAMIALLVAIIYLAIMPAKADTGAPILTNGRVSIVSYGAVGDGHTLNDAAIQQAIAAARAAGAEIDVPPGVYALSAGITLDGIGLHGEGAGSQLKWLSLGPGVTAITIVNTWNGNESIVISDLRISGGGRWAVGVKNGVGDGISWTGHAAGYMDHVRVDAFDSGVVLGNLIGHIYLNGCRLTNNYYGVYCAHGSSDYVITDSTLDGNNYASIAVAGDQAFDDLNVTNTHLGFGPIGVYQEPLPTPAPTYSAFLIDCHFDHCRWEQIGNFAIETDALANYNNVVIDAPGFGWGDASTYSIPSLPRAYAVSLGLTTGYNQIYSGAHPFINAVSGGQAIHIKTLQGTFHLLDSSATSTNSMFSVGSGIVHVSLTH